MSPADPEHGRDHAGTRSRTYRSRGVDVEIRESPERVELILDGHPIKVTYLDGQYSSQTANMFRTFDSVEEIVDELLRTEGRTWTLHGNPAHDHGKDHDHDHDHGDHDHDHDHGDHGDHGDHDHGDHGHGGGQP